MKVGILTANFGQGHHALASKLKSHLVPLKNVDTSIINLSERSEYFFRQKQKTPFRLMRYLLHKEVHFGYNQTVKLPKWLLSIHPLTVGSRYFVSFYSFLVDFFERFVYGHGYDQALFEELSAYDVVFSVVPCSHYHLWKNHPRWITVNVAQDFGDGVTCVWWGQFWDFFISSDKRNMEVSNRRLGNKTKKLRLGPLYFLEDYQSLSSDVMGKDSLILLVPGLTGVTASFHKHMVNIALEFLKAGFQVVWKSNGMSEPSAFHHISPSLKERIVIEEKGPLQNLETYSLIVGKGSYNQISEALLHGTPYACVKFLGYWEEGNQVIAWEGMHLLNWTQSFSIPSKKDLSQMKKDQIVKRDEFFSSPEKWQAELKAILYSQKPLDQCHRYTIKRPNFLGKISFDLHHGVCGRLHIRIIMLLAGVTFFFWGGCLLIRHFFQKVRFSN